MTPNTATIYFDLNISNTPAERMQVIKTTSNQGFNPRTSLNYREAKNKRNKYNKNHQLYSNGFQSQ